MLRTLTQPQFIVDSPADLVGVTLPEGVTIYDTSTQSLSFKASSSIPDVSSSNAPAVSSYIVYPTSDSFTITETSGEYLYVVDCTAGNRTVTLPSTGGNHLKASFKKKDATANTLTINGAGNTIDDNSTITLRKQWELVTLYTDEAVWYIGS